MVIPSMFKQRALFSFGNKRNSAAEVLNENGCNNDYLNS